MRFSPSRQLSIKRPQPQNKLMKNLEIQPTKISPLVKYYEGENMLEINGESYPENAVEFFRPVLDWLEEHLSENEGMFTLNLKLTYFNTSSSKCLLDLIDRLEDRHGVKPDVQVKWFHQQEDEDMMESGEEFAEGLELPFTLVPY
jgi:SiaC family regulatory phosphoprotein